VPGRQGSPPRAAAPLPRGLSTRSADSHLPSWAAGRSPGETLVPPHQFVVRRSDVVPLDDSRPACGQARPEISVCVQSVETPDQGAAVAHRDQKPGRTVIDEFGNARVPRTYSGQPVAIASVPDEERRGSSFAGDDRLTHTLRVAESNP
jgi:hypothetical protein